MIYLLISGQVYQFPPIVVTGSRFPTSFSDFLRTVSVVTREEAENFPVTSVTDLVGLTSVQLDRRGPFDIQSDLSIRGSTFEQVIIMVDGVKINDYQTGHHIMDIPLTLFDIDRVEVLRGVGSGLYGPNGFGGVVNFITKKERGRVAVTASYGEHDLKEGGFSISQPIGKFHSSASILRRSSDGYRENTDFGQWFLTSKLSYKDNLNIITGYKDNDFGAYEFYSTKYPNQKEYTRTFFSSCQTNIQYRMMFLRPNFAYRYHYDDYLLDRFDPEFYHNTHNSYTYSTELPLFFYLPFAEVAVGGEYESQRLNSTALGDHQRSRTGLFCESRVAIKNLTINPSLRGDHYDGYGWEPIPCLSLGYKFAPFLNLHLTVGKGYRIPTFTDLYYESPTNLGNPDLKPEYCTSYEAGARYLVGEFLCDLSLFMRTGRSLISWVSRDSGATWQAENYTEADFQGGDLTILYKGLRIGYSYLTGEKKEKGLLDAYLLDYYEHKILVAVSRDLFGFGISPMIHYRKRPDGDGFYLCDLRITRPVDPIDLCFDVKNIFDAEYYETGRRILMPGRWLMCGVRLSI